MTCLSWSLEFIAGIIFLIKSFFIKDITTVLYLLFIDNTLSFVIVPSSYILNTEVIKGFIIGNGWLIPLTTLFRSSKIVPAPNNNIEMQANANVELRDRVVPESIPTISGNVSVLLNVDEPNVCMSVLETLSENIMEQSDG